MNRLKILLVESSVVDRVAIVEAVNATDYGVVERSASNGSIAYEWLKQCEFDVILVDVTIISNEGISLIKSIKGNFPEVEIIIISNGHPNSPSVTLDSLKIGAMDFIQKSPGSDIGKLKLELKAHLQILFAQIILRKYSKPSNIIATENKEGNLSVQTKINQMEQKSITKITHNKDIWGKVDMIMIASSTGGPVALEEIFSKLSSEIHKPILIVQHMPPDFTNLLAKKLDERYHFKVTEGKNGDLIEAGKIIIAPGGKHMTVTESEGLNKTIRLLNTDFVNGVRPSADVLFNSVADIYEGKNILTVVLTGMGNDGTKGISELKKKCNCYCITQSENSCVVYGMPKCVNEAGLSDEVVDLKDIAYRIYQIEKGIIH